MIPRGYCVNPFYADLIRNHDSDNWEEIVGDALKGIEPLMQKLQRNRQIERVSVTLPSGGILEFSPGKHNKLQKEIIEEFLPRNGAESEILYVGDATDKYLLLEVEKLRELNFFEIAHGELPDVIAYSQSKNWRYLIEAVHSSGPINEVRLLQLQRLTQNCKTEIVFVTAFLTRSKFRQFLADIAWETEVWIAENPDHLVHFNGDKFLGPYPKE